jgi:thiamine biosynthesis protein ThiS
VATAVNGSFIASNKRALTPLSPEDEVEIVAPRQGG